MLFCLQHPVLGLQAFDATEMLGVVSHYGKVVFARCDADEQVEILNGLAMDSSRTFSRLNASAARALLACLSKNVVNANDVVIARQQSRLCQFLLTVANGGIVGSV